MKKILKDEFKTTEWSGGTTSQIFIDPENADVAKKDFDFRISSATCDLEKSEFTPYDEFKRYIMPLNGGLKLTSEKEFVNLEPYDIYNFDGAENIVSEGKVRDYNLIVRKNHSGRLYTHKFFNNKKFTLECDCKNLVIFNYKSNIDYNFEGEEAEFDKFSAIILEKNEKIILSGKGTVVICEIH